MTFSEENVPPGMVPAREMLIGALLRAPSEAIHRRIIRELNAAGFKGLSMPHMAIFRYPGPDGERPGVIAERANMSKQAINRLLGSLEDLGYLKRSDAPEEGRARIVNFTRRGHAAYAKAIEILRNIERDWIEELGPRHFARLKFLLGRVWESPLVR
jgi:DNA-binding MarR family transcriptional regulator